MVGRFWQVFDIFFMTRFLPRNNLIDHTVHNIHHHIIIIVTDFLITYDEIVHMLNEVQIKRWAKLHKEPLFFYYEHRSLHFKTNVVLFLPMTSQPHQHIFVNVEYDNVMALSKGHYEENGERARALNTHYGGFKKYFTRGAPCILTGPYSVNVSEGIANGSFCRMHSLTFEDGQDYVTDEQKHNFAKLVINL